MITIATAVVLFNALMAATVWAVMSGAILRNAIGRDEFLKFLFEVIQLELVGSGVWVLKEQYKHSRAKADEMRAQHEADLRARAEARHSFLEDIRRRLRKAYADVKRCRRLLKARVGTAIHRGEFDLELLHALGERLMEPQLELEGLKWEAIGAVRPGGLFERADDIPEDLRTMENYANDLSKALMRFAAPAKPKDLELLNDCVGKYENSRFESQFGAPYDRLTAAVMRERAVRVDAQG
jgi:hypothetical protein